MNKTFIRIWRTSLIFMVAVGLFWLGFFILKGYVPSETTVGFITEDLTLFKLSFSVSRWFDILVAPFWLSVIFIWYGDSPKDDGSKTTPAENAEAIAFVGTILGFIDALIVGIVSGLATTIILLFTVLLGWFLYQCVKALVKWAFAI